MGRQDALPWKQLSGASNSAKELKCKRQDDWHSITWVNVVWGVLKRERERRHSLAC